MSRRPLNPSRRYGGGTFTSILSRSPPPRLLSITLTLLGVFLIVAYLRHGGGGVGSGAKRAISRVQGDYSSTLEIPLAIPTLNKAYGDSMHKVLHVGPDTCDVVFQLRKQEETQAWGIEPYDIEDADTACKGLVRKGIVRVADIKFQLPYKSKSFSLVLVSDALDYLSPKYLNKTLPELARVSADGLVVFTGQPGQQRAKSADVSKFGRAAKLRSSAWWVRYFAQTSLEENEAAAKKFEQAAKNQGYDPSCQIFHLKPLP
ncbi:hypothetical protein ACFE04_007777 [Oxalis oulophora]